MQGEKISMLEKLFKIEDKNGMQVLFWTLIGPFFLILTLALTTMQKIDNADLFVVSAIGLFLCLKRKKRGLYLALFTLLGVSLYKHLQLYSHHFFELGMEASVALGLIISYLAFEYISVQIGKLEGKENQFQDEMAKAEEKLAKEIDFHERQHKNFKFEMDRLGALLNEKEEEGKTLKSLSDNLRHLLNEKEKEIGNLKTALAKPQINDDVEEMKAALLEKEKLLQDYENRVIDLKQMEILYKQLKTQFEEKKTLLASARKEAFLLKEEIEKLNREKEDNNSENNPLIRDLQKEMGKMDSELSRFEKEGDILENIITKVVKEGRLDSLDSLEKDPEKEAFEKPEKMAETKEEIDDEYDQVEDDAQNQQVAQEFQEDEKELAFEEPEDFESSSS